MIEMKAHLRPYRDYKPSDIEWMGEIPAHWDARRLKFVVSINPEALQETTDPSYEILYVDIGHVTELGLESEPKSMRFGDAPSRARRIVRPHDVIISTVRTYLKAIAYFEAPLQNLIASTGFAVLRPQSIEPRYLSYFVSSPIFIEKVTAHSVGVSYPAISPSSLAGFHVLLPPLPEQRTIAAFLDRETARIDALIAKKQRLIELLLEKRTALISHAVTKGLNPDAPMKDSGVEWIGEIPVGWEVRKLRFLIKGGLVNGIFKKKDAFGRGTKLVNVSDLYREDFLVCHKNLDRVDATREETARYSVNEGDIFFVRSSLKLEGVGASVCIQEVPEPTIFECHVVRARPDRMIVEPMFLTFVLNSSMARQRFIALAETTTMTTISQSKLSSIEIPFPPLTEQKEVIRFIESESSKIMGLISNIRAVIEKLQEYRTALISAAVTGKIDVREAV